MHPIPEKILHFMKHMTLKAGGTSLEFDRGGVSQHSCGTAGCHGVYLGDTASDLIDLLKWRKWLEEINIKDKEGKDPEELVASLQKHSGFVAGAYAFSFYIGLDRCVNVWANDNPKLWGNTKGKIMFTGSGYEAFDMPKTMTVHHVIQRWKDVAGRIKALESQNVEEGTEIA